MPVPDTVEEVLMARIDRLPEGAKSVLQMGAVIGREFSGELLRELRGSQSGSSWSSRDPHRAELLYAGGLPSQTTYLFKHAFTQEAAYRSLLTARRREFHHRVAVTLETLFPDRLEEYYGSWRITTIGRAEDRCKALQYAVRAGDRYMALPAYAEAIRFYQMALEAWRVRNRWTKRSAARCCWRWVRRKEGGRIPRRRKPSSVLPTCPAAWDRKQPGPCCPGVRQTVWTFRVSRGVSSTPPGRGPQDACRGRQRPAGTRAR